MLVDLMEMSKPGRHLWKEWSVCREKQGRNPDVRMGLAYLRKNKEANVIGTEQINRRENGDQMWRPVG